MLLKYYRNIFIYFFIFHFHIFLFVFVTDLTYPDNLNLYLNFTHPIKISMAHFEYNFLFILFYGISQRVRI